MILLSIIICTYNQEALLKNCLDELVKQMPSFADTTEVIVVDNNCVDGTAAMVDRYREQHTWLRYVKEEKQGLSHARNRGAQEARGSYLCYLDDDGKPGKGYLIRLHHVLNKHQPDIAGGPVYPYYTTPKPRWFKDEFEIRKHSPYSGFKKKCSVSGGNFVIRKDLLTELGMFSPELGMVGNKTRLGEEKAVLIKYRSTRPVKEQRVYYSLEFYIYHHVPKRKMRLSYMIKRGFMAGISLVQIKNTNVQYLRKFVRDLMKAVFLDFIPMLLTGARENDHPVLAMQRAALISGKIFQVLRNALRKKFQRD